MDKEVLLCWLVCVQHQGVWLRSMHRRHKYVSSKWQGPEVLKYSFCFVPTFNSKRTYCVQFHRKWRATELWSWRYDNWQQRKCICGHVWRFQDSYGESPVIGGGQIQAKLVQKLIISCLLVFSELAKKSWISCSLQPKLHRPFSVDLIWTFCTWLRLRRTQLHPNHQKLVICFRWKVLVYMVIRECQPSFKIRWKIGSRLFMQIKNRHTYTYSIGLILSV